jgi:hypothetical protein
MKAAMSNIMQPDNVLCRRSHQDAALLGAAIKYKTKVENPI